MSEKFKIENLVRDLDDAVAVVALEGWEILYENSRFFQWFPNQGDDEAALDQRISGFKSDRAESRVSAGRVYKQDAEYRAGARTTTIEVSIRAFPEYDGLALVEARDSTAQKQSEYMLKSYSDVSERSMRELQKEKERVERLLLNVMPRSVYEEMKEFGTTTPARFEEATVLLLDFVGFTDMAISREPAELVTELNDIFSAFDRVVEMFGCERIKTIGDAYMAVSGMPEANPEHAASMARVALRLRRYLERRNKAHTRTWECRIGLATGSVIGSIVGIQKYVYDIFGPGVNLTARMEAHSEAMRITVDQSTYHLIKNEFQFEERGRMEIKGFGQRKLYFLERELERTTIRSEGGI
jgi:adenylate cyclase